MKLPEFVTEEDLTEKPLIPFRVLASILPPATIFTPVGTAKSNCWPQLPERR